MIEVETITRKWGNSIGITLPKDELEKEEITENEPVLVLVIKQNQTPKSTFGMFKGKIPKSTQQIKDELKKELYNE